MSVQSNYYPIHHIQNHGIGGFFTRMTVIAKKKPLSFDFFYWCDVVSKYNYTKVQMGATWNFVKKYWLKIAAPVRVAHLHFLVPIGALGYKIYVFR